MNPRDEFVVRSIAGASTPIPLRPVTRSEPTTRKS